LEDVRLFSACSFSACSDTIKNDTSGTSAHPIFVGVIPGKNTGVNFLFKVGEKYYPTSISNRNKKTLSLRCRANRDRDGGCRFTAALLIIRHFDREHPDFYKRENFRVKPKQIATGHTCQGYGAELEARQIYRQFLREEVRRGETSYDEIKTKSPMVSADPTLFGNDTSHRRVVARLNRLKNDSTDQPIETASNSHLNTIMPS